MALRILGNLLLVVTMGLPSLSQASCLYEGIPFPNGTIWQPDACSVCTCQSQVVMCEQVRCEDPGCDYLKGEQLRIGVNRCCPECVSSSHRSCDYNGQTIPHNKDWHPSKCVECVCEDGLVSCHNKTCPSGRCRPGEVMQQLPGQCCSQCTPAGRSCHYEGVERADGSEWQPVDCSRCVCRDGQVRCYAAQCPLLVCQQEERLAVLGDDCCPSCVGPPCHVGNKQYQHGEQWQRDACTYCICSSGKTSCISNDCEDSQQCQAGELRVKSPGSCCHECVRNTGRCDVDGTTYYSGAMWNRSACEYCVCRDGRVSCHQVQCQPVQCTQVEEVVHHAGKCCGECRPISTCNFDGIFYKESDVWHPDPCTLCRCEAGAVSCFQSQCTACPEGATRLTVPGECCGECKQLRCHPDCLGCDAGNPHFCTSCRDPQKLLQQGHCIESCSPGHYPTTENTCSGCHESCETCIGATPFHCLTCHAGLLLLDGQCVERCGQGYHRDGQACTGCHGNCATCIGLEVYQCITCPPGQVISQGTCAATCHNHGHYTLRGECHACDKSCKSCLTSSSCSSCHQGEYLQEGKCVSQCSTGFFPDSKNICRACHPSCKSCKGERKRECLSCYGAAMLDQGQCKTGCDPGKFLTSKGFCRDCNSTCAECHYSPSVEHNICSSCEDSQQVALGTGCEPSCGNGRYLRQGRCRECGHGCAVCIDDYRCTRCDRGRVLQAGQCVVHCGSGYFLQNGICRACPDGCMRCSSAATCQQCSGATYLKRNKCVPRCGRGFYQDVKMRKCEANQAAPVLHMSVPVLVKPGSIALLSPDHIQVSDQDTSLEKLSVILQAPPTNGHLTVVRGGQDEVLKVNTSFSVIDLMSGRVRFIHLRNSDDTGEIWLQPSDRQLKGAKVKLEVRVVSENPLQVAHKEVLQVMRGGKAVIDSRHLTLMGIGGSTSSSSMILISLLRGPKQGQILSKAGKLVQSFTVQDLEQGNIWYIHAGNNASGQFDHLMFQARTGQHVLNVPFTVDIQLGNHRVPVLTTNKVLHVDEGGLAQITAAHLRATLEDKADRRLIYTLTPPSSNPREGEIWMIVPIPSDGARQGWKDLGDGKMAAMMYRFMQQDVDEGRIWYKHSKGDKSNSDFFLFQVSDTSRPPNILKEQTFNIAIMKPQGDQALPTLAPGVRLGMTVLENQMVPITSQNLAYVDIDTDDHDIVYTITRPLAQEEGTIENVEQAFRPVRRFTQDDINKNKIIYRPPVTEIGANEKEFSFQFRIRDRASGKALPLQRFTMRVMPVNNMPPRLQTTNPRITVTQGGSVPIGGNVLKVSDPDTDLKDLILKVLQAPTAGEFVKNEGGIRVVLREGDTFTYEEVLNNVFVYHHDGSVIQQDQIEMSVEDGAQAISISIDLFILKVDKSAPKLAPDSSMTFTLPEGSTVTLGREHMAFADQDSLDNRILISLASSVQHGGLVLRDHYERMKIGNSFTQADINNGHIRYTADAEIGIDPISEIMYFNVSDSSKNILPMQVLHVTISPRNNQPPQVTVGPDVQVEEGGRVQLTGEHISATDIDTPLAGLAVFINALPTFGVIENTGKGLGSERSLKRIVSSFPIQDLLNGNIYYVQSNSQNKEPVWDGFLFHVSDGVNHSPTQRFNISIVLQNDEAPMMVTEQVYCQESRAVVINNATMYVVDFDTPAEDLIITVQATPQHGKLRRREFTQGPLFTGHILQRGSTFTYEDVLRELIIYTHEGAEVTADQFDLQVSDGIHDDRKTVHVVIGLVNDETPRVTINRGLRVPFASTTPLSAIDLKATDVDSEDADLIYILSQDPTFGKLQLERGGADGLVDVHANGDVDRFTQADIDNGAVFFVHGRDDAVGTTVLKFTLTDSHDNALIDQTFVISIIEDRVPPQVLKNSELIVRENSAERITTQYLSSTDQDSEPANLKYLLVTTPTLGHLEHTGRPGIPTAEFTQADLAANCIVYVHTSQEELYMDKFTFSVSDGTNEVTQTFYITITPVDDALPLVTSNKIRAQEGIRKVITEFDLKAVDKDTTEDLIEFHIVQSPVHGSIDIKMGADRFAPTDRFKMSDIYENRVSYSHDGSETVEDNFKFTVSDGTNPLFMVRQGTKEVQTSRPVQCEIEVIPVDDGTPVLETNLGLHHLEYVDGKAMKHITAQELKATDIDTSPTQLLYQITTPPAHGHLETTVAPSRPITIFTQEDVNNGVVRYVLTSQDASVTEDSFNFDLVDSKPNIVSGNMFHIRWSTVSFESPKYNISEKAGLIRIPVRRYGNLKQYSLVVCRTTHGSATSAGTGPQPGFQDFVQHSEQIQFDEWQDVKTCTVVINDDSLFEGPESFTVELEAPSYTLIGQPARAEVTIYDTEDEPVLQFEEGVYQVNESVNYLLAKVVRTGDVSTSTSAICSTTSMTATGSSVDRVESGSDYITRPKTNSYRVVFPAGITTATCDVRIIDDSEFENTEQFELTLSDPAMMTRIGPVSKALVLINGPNDASIFHFSSHVYNVNEDSGQVEIPVIREGSDLSHSSMVWCASRLSDPASATPGQDYIPHSMQVMFGPGQREQACLVTILDDASDPRVEGEESFILFLSSPMGSTLEEPLSALVIINDTSLDVPVMNFAESQYIVDESEQKVDVLIVRTGDLSYESSVICYTRQRTAQVMMDYDERVFTEASRITFKPGESSKNCTVGIVDDPDFEVEESFLLKLAHPKGTEACEARVGDLHTTTITITNYDDVTKISLKQAAYSINEPTRDEDYATITIPILRTGDVSTTARVRCSTRDGSAESGLDYDANSRIVIFEEEEREQLFLVDVLYNDEVEWHETFSVELGPMQPENAVFGDITVATITILDNEVAGSVVLPAPPVVVSLLDYGDVEAGMTHNPSPGYPIVCVSPCDTHYPTYSQTGPLCAESGINQTAMQYHWEVAMPRDGDGAQALFETVTDNTLFTQVNTHVLDSIYFRSKFQLRCVAQPLHENGNLGVPLRSKSVTIGVDNGICQSPVVSGRSRGFHAQSFKAKSEYVAAQDQEHPNRIHINVQIPHRDGMLPLLSTFPLHNTRFLLTEPVYRQQHVCSNMISPSERQDLTDYGFLDPFDPKKILYGPGFNKPYQFDPRFRSNQTIDFYKHLDLNSCVWTFDAWYHMTELIDICGGSVIPNFQVRDSAQTYLTIRVPLYVSYIYATAPTGWASLEHRTEMEFSFFYKTVLWRTGLETEGKRSGQLQVLKIAIGEDGKLVIDFKTQAKFRGQFVMQHHTLPGETSKVIPPSDLPITFDLVSLWSQQTYDGPQQLWRATSNHNLRDYSGTYRIELIPCTVSSTQAYTVLTDLPQACTAHEPTSFQLPISFQQTNQPLPVTYTLNTQFQITNNEKMFLLDPASNPGPGGDDSMELDDVDFVGSFLPGQTVYGRVLWNPEQDLESAYRLSIEKLYICTGRDGFVPVFDPTGDIHGEGPQFGCIQPSVNLQHRFLILDRGSPESATKTFQGVSFEAAFSSEKPELAEMSSIQGMDGFVLSVDPLYKVEAGHEWYLQVLYVIGAADSLHPYRYQRSVRSLIHKRDTKFEKRVQEPQEPKNGTNMVAVRLNATLFEDSNNDARTSSGSSQDSAKVIAPAICGVAAVLCLIICILFVCRRRRRHRKKDSKSSSQSASKPKSDNRDIIQTDISKTVTVRHVNVNTLDNKAADRRPTTHVRVKDVNLKVHLKNKRLSGTEV